MDERQGQLSQSWVERDREFEQELGLNLEQPGLTIVEIVDNRMSAAEYALCRYFESNARLYLFNEPLPYVNSQGVHGVNL